MVALLAAGAVAGAGAQIFSAIKQSQAAQLQAAISARNANMQNALGRSNLALQKAGRTDIRGNVTEFIPGVGFVTTASPLTASLIRAQDLEQRKRLTTDAAIRREALESGQAIDRAITRPTAVQEGLRFQHRVPMSGKALEGALRERGVRGVKQGFADAANTLGRTLIRSGDSTSAGKFAAQRAREQSRAEGDVTANAPIQGQQLAEALNASQDQRLGNSALSFINAAGRVPDSPFIPQGIDASTAATQAQIAPNVNRGTLIAGSLAGAANRQLVGSINTQPFKGLDRGIQNLFGGLAFAREIGRQRKSTGAGAG